MIIKQTGYKTSGVNVPITLSKYIAKQSLSSIMIATGVIVSVIFLADLFELLRKSAGKENIQLYRIIEMAFLRLPEMAQKISPFAILIGGIMSLTKLSKTSELIVARSIGMSVWQFTMPSILVSVALGFFILMVFNPLAATLLARYEQLEARLFSGKASILAVSSSGLWLKQSDKAPDGSQIEKIIHAMRISQRDMMLYEVIIFSFDENDRLIQRVDAETAKLEEGAWQVSKALITSPNSPANRLDELKIPTNMTNSELQDSFSSPETLSFWELTGFIKTLEKAGFSALKHRLHWNSLLSLPIMFASMILIAASFALRVKRGKKVGVIIGSGIFTGFIIYFLSDLIHALGLSGAMPVAVAAWTPPLVTLLIGVATLLHYEDG